MVLQMLMMDDRNGMRIVIDLKRDAVANVCPTSYTNMPPPIVLIILFG